MINTNLKSILKNRLKLSTEETICESIKDY